MDVVTDGITIIPGAVVGVPETFRAAALTVVRMPRRAAPATSILLVIHTDNRDEERRNRNSTRRSAEPKGDRR